MRGGMLATEQLQQSIIEGLHTEADSVHAALAQEPRLSFGNAAGIRFQGPFAQLRQIQLRVEAGEQEVQLRCR